MAGTDFCPYVGLRPFTAAERAYFFGRESDERVIAANLFAAPLTVLYGPSAVGKSSVLQAGVVPQLQSEPHTAIVYFATWQDVSYLDRLRKACHEAVVTAPGGAGVAIDPTLPLDEWLAQAAASFRGTLMLILDQFEEYLLYHSETAASAFDDQLARIVNRRDVTAHVLLGIRDDGLAKLDRFRKRIPNLLGNTLRLRRLAPDDAREAIQGPIDVYNREGRGSALPMRIEPALVDAVVVQVRANAMRMSAAGGVGVVKASEKVSEEDELIETALLQLVMTRLWNDATVTPTERVMETKALDKLGGARNVVKLHLYDRLKELPPAGQMIAAELFQHLVTPSGAKIAHTTEDLIAFAGQPATSVIPVLEYLAKARLLRRVDPPERYEIFHDALAAAILDWRTEYMREATRQAALAEANKRRRRRRVLVAVTMTIVAIVGVALGIAFYERRNAQQIELLAEGLKIQATGLQLQSQSNEAQVTAAKQLQIASDRAREVAERAAEEAQLRLEKGQALLDAERAGLERQTARQADLLAKAKSKEDEIGKVVQAKNTAAKEQEVALNQASQAQQQVNAIAVEQKKELDLSKIGYNKVTAPTAAPPAPATTLPDATKAPSADTKPPAYGGTAAGGGAAGGATVAQGDYKAIYRQAINQRDRKQWSAAERLFESAAAIKPDSGETITMPGAGADQPYLPYYYLGLVRQNQKDCAGALDAWRRAEDAGAVLKSRESQAFRNHRAECGGGK